MITSSGTAEDRSGVIAHTHSPQAAAVDPPVPIPSVELALLVRLKEGLPAVTHPNVSFDLTIQRGSGCQSCQLQFIRVPASKGYALPKVNLHVFLTAQRFDEVFDRVFQCLLREIALDLRCHFRQAGRTGIDSFLDLDQV